MAFGTAKLKLAHLFVSTKRLSKHMLSNEREANAILRRLENDYYALLKEALKYGSNPQALWIAQDFCNQAFEFSSKAVFGAEQESLLYIMRKYDNFEEIANDFNNSVVNKGKYLSSKNVGVSEETQNKIREIISGIKKEEQEIHGIIRKVFREIRHERKDREVFRDKMFNLRQDADLRKDLKEMRQKSTAEHKFSEKSEHLVGDLEKEFKKLDGKETSTQIESKIGKTLDELEAAVVKDEKVLVEVIQDAAYVIKYALHQFFRCEELLEKFEHYYWQLHEQHYLTDETASNAKTLFERLQQRLDDKAKQTYRIVRKYRKKAFKEEMDQ